MKSAFEVEKQWMHGELNASHVTIPDWEEQLKHFGILRDELCKEYSLEFETPPRSDHEIEGKVYFDDESRLRATNLKSLTGTWQKFIIRLKSHVAGEQTLLQCESPIAEMDLKDNNENMRELSKLINTEQSAKICVEPRTSRSLDRVFVRQEILFDPDPDVSSPEDLRHLFESVVPFAAKLKFKLNPKPAGGE